MKLKDIKMIIEIILGGFKVLSLLKEAFKKKNKKLKKQTKKTVVLLAKANNGNQKF